MFKRRSAAATDSPPSIELVRQRAKHRLIGVSILVLAAVVLFPMLFDTQPRAIPVDIPIEIPSRKTAKPLTVEPTPVLAESAAPVAASAAVPDAGPKGSQVAKAKAEDEEVILSHTPARPAAAAPAVPPMAAVAPAMVESPKLPQAAPREVPAASPKVGHKEPVKAALPKEPVKDLAKEPAREAAKEVAKEPAKPSPAKDASAEAARAQALLEGKLPAAVAKPAAEAEGSRFIVQVGAFADPAVAQAARLKLERAGLKTYTHEAQTPDGKRIRVRLGPFATRAEAEKAAAKAKATGTAAAILTL
ncbi:MAG TPA: SPOR domain-containing protein [Burkholderiaceae bacterium]|nr:SPOR domain-containing protein [Burkholderiaceae bacterium]